MSWELSKLTYISDGRADARMEGQTKIRGKTWWQNLETDFSRRSGGRYPGFASLGSLNHACSTCQGLWSTTTPAASPPGTRSLWPATTPATPTPPMSAAGETPFSGHYYSHQIKSIRPFRGLYPYNN